jgi:hypothetical protein
LRKTADMADTTDAVREWARGGRICVGSGSSEIEERLECGKASRADAILTREDEEKEGQIRMWGMVKYQKIKVLRNERQVEAQREQGRFREDVAHLP